MEIQFKKDITKKGQDGIGLLYDNKGEEVEVQVSGTVLGIWGIEVGNTDELLKRVGFEPLIEALTEDGSSLKKIDISSNGISVKGKMVYTREDCERLCKIAFG